MKITLPRGTTAVSAFVFLLLLEHPVLAANCTADYNASARQIEQDYNRSIAELNRNAGLNRSYNKDKQYIEQQRKDSLARARQALDECNREAAREARDRIAAQEAQRKADEAAKRMQQDAIDRAEKSRRDAEYEAARVKQDADFKKSQEEWKTKGEQDAARRKQRQQEQDASFANQRQAQQTQWDQWNTQRKTRQQQFYDKLEQQRKDSQAESDKYWSDFRNRVADDVPQTLFDAVRDGVEEDTGLRTHVPGENAVNKVKEYTDEANRRVDNVSPLENPISSGIREKLGPKIDSMINNPKAEVLGSHNSGTGNYLPAIGGSQLKPLLDRDSLPSIPTVLPRAPIDPNGLLPRSKYENPSPTPTPTPALRRTEPKTLLPRDMFK